MRKPEFYMHRALELAQQAFAEQEVPVGAVVVNAQGEIIGRGYNQVIQTSDPCAHAEIQALRDAGRTLGNYRLSGCHLYVTLEPCTLCAGGMINARISHLYYGASEPRTGVIESVCNLPAQPWYRPSMQVTGGILAAPARRLLKAFFQQKRL